jgi:hypothetical protein
VESRSVQSLTRQPVFESEVIDHDLIGKDKIRFASGRAYRVFKMKNGYLLLQDAAYANSYRPLILMPLERRAECAVVDIFIFSSGPIQLIAAGMYFLVTAALNRQWDIVAGIVSVVAIAHLAFCGLFEFERRRALRDLKEIIQLTLVGGPRPR